MTREERELRRAATKAAAEEGLTRTGDRNINIDRLKRSPGFSPPVMYSERFQDYFVWLLSGPGPAETLGDPSGAEPEHSLPFDVPIKLYEVIPYIKYLLGDELEHLYGFAAIADDYQYLADLLVMGASKLPAPPANVVRATAWLNEQISQAKASAAAHTPGLSAPLKWVGDTVEITQLGYALVAAGKVSGATKGKFIQALGAFFGREITAPAKAINNFKGNKNKKGTLLDKLKAALDDVLEE